VASDIVAVGMACYDHIVLVPSLARVVEGCRARRVLSQGGGVVATAAVAASALGARVELWARAGADFYGRFVVDELRRFGVDTSQFVIVDGGHTAVSTVLVDEATGERRFLYFPGDGLDKGWDEPDYARIERAKLLLTDGRWPGVCLEATRRAVARGVPVVFDPGHASAEELEMLRLADYPVISEVALGELSQGRSLDELADELLGGRAKAVVVTRGARGLWLRERGRPPEELGAFPVEVVDTTGAGDVFHGAFALAISRGWEPVRAAELASAAGAHACTALGGRGAIPSMDVLERMLASPSRPVWRPAG